MSFERIVETDEQYKKRMTDMLGREYGKDSMAVGLKQEQTALQHLHYPSGPHLPTNAQERKQIPLYSGLVKYFPDALVEVAKLSQKGNDQHNPGQPLHWAREKSTDQEDTLLRHLFEAGTTDTDGCRHSAKVAWRALAMLQLEIERSRNVAGSVQCNLAQAGGGPYEGFIRK